MNLISIKRHETVLCKHEPTFLFSSKGIPTTNQHTDPHPCIRLRWPRSLIEWPHSQTMSEIWFFFIETKFIFNILRKLHRQNESQDIPRLRLFMISSYYHILKSKNQKNMNVHTKNLRFGTQDFPKFWDFQILRFPKSIFSKDVPIFSGIF